MGERFLDIDMLAEGHGVGRHDSVGVVGSRDKHGVDVLAHLVEHDSPVLEALCGGVVIEGFHRICPVHVAEGDYVLRGHILEIPAADSSDADSRDVQLVARGDMAEGLTENVTRNNRKCGCSGGCRHTGLDELPS